MRDSVLSGLRWGVFDGFLLILRRETDWLYRDCFDGGDGGMRGRTPPACGHPLSEGDDLTPTLSWRRGSCLTDAGGN